MTLFPCKSLEIFKVINQIVLRDLKQFTVGRILLPTIFPGIQNEKEYCTTVQVCKIYWSVDDIYTLFLLTKQCSISTIFTRLHHKIYGKE
jgi:hypothetical protein